VTVGCVHPGILSVAGDRCPRARRRNVFAVLHPLWLPCQPLALEVPRHVLHPRCACIDVHKKTVLPPLLRTAPRGQTTKLTQTFGTLTAGLLQSDAWLEQHAVTPGAMESPGV